MTQEYIITEEQIKDLLIAGEKRDKTDEIRILNDVFSRPYIKNKQDVNMVSVFKDAENTHRFPKGYR